ncbi:MAG: TIGR01777 family oxidoreductase [Planctomycetaceae bacterium]
MRILVSGSSGLVGSALIPSLAAAGHDVVRLVRSRSANPSKDLISWDPSRGQIDAAGLEGIDAVVHLAGESIASGRWNAERKARIRDSRSIGTRLLAETLAKLRTPPKVFACASAIGFYGDRGDEVLSESSTPGTGFLADVCRDWEIACDPLKRVGTRVVNLRFGVVLSRQGGALKQMLLPFQMGAGGILGNGKQYMSCVSLNDAVGVIEFVLGNPAVEGPINVVCPQPVTNYDYTKSLGSVLHRPTIFPVPGFAARLAFGEMADALLLSSARVVPDRLLAAGYQFRDPTVETSLRSALR